MHFENYTTQPMHHYEYLILYGKGKVYHKYMVGEKSRRIMQSNFNMINSAICASFKSKINRYKCKENQQSERNNNKWPQNFNMQIRCINSTT